MSLRHARVVVGVVLGLLTVVAAGLLLLPRAAGWEALVVTSGSMEPTISTGSVVLAGPVEVQDLAVGDVITFVGRDGLVTHRLVGMETVSVGDGSKLALVTQGDANEEADPTAVDPRNVVGKARFVAPRVGHFLAMVQTPWGSGVLATLFLFVLLTDGSKRREDDREPGAREAIAA